MLVLKFLLQVHLLRDFLAVLQLQVDHVFLEVHDVILCDRLEPLQKVLVLLLQLG